MKLKVAVRIRNASTWLSWQSLEVALYLSCSGFVQRKLCMTLGNQSENYFRSGHSTCRYGAVFLIGFEPLVKMSSIILPTMAMWHLVYSTGRSGVQYQNNYRGKCRSLRIVKNLRHFSLESLA